LEYLSWEKGTIILLTDILTFNSNFNQMFLLGRYDYKKFKEVYNNFPTARAFEVLD
jgi:dolichyl-diphosphooligosaccharide--protein glycosyltransferase